MIMYAYAYAYMTKIQQHWAYFQWEIGILRNKALLVNKLIYLDVATLSRKP